MRIPILYQDEDIVVVDKPAGIPTHAAEPGDPYPGDAVRIVQAQLGLSYLGMHQRLDADTSGVLLFAARHAGQPGPGRGLRRAGGAQGVPGARSRTAPPAGRRRRRADRTRARRALQGDHGQGPAGASRLARATGCWQRRPTGAAACSRSSPRPGAATRYASTWPHSASGAGRSAVRHGAGAAPVPARVPTHPAAPGQRQMMTFTAPPPALFEQVRTGLPVLGQAELDGTARDRQSTGKPHYTNCWPWRSRAVRLWPPIRPRPSTGWSTARRTGCRASPSTATGTSRWSACMTRGQRPLPGRRRAAGTGASRCRPSSRMR